MEVNKLSKYRPQLASKTSTCCWRLCPPMQTACWEHVVVEPMLQHQACPYFAG